MDQLSEIYYQNQILRNEVEDVILKAKCLSEKQKERWRSMLFVLTRNQLKELKNLILRENTYTEHPQDFFDEESDAFQSENY